ncbi:MAG: glycosyltransferase family 4 protein, partial [Chthoniobacterales bacterium]
MRLAIISTIFHYPWGGPDKRWTALAEACQARGDAVFLGLAPLTVDHPRVRALVEKGATLWLRPNRSAYVGKVDQWARRVPFVRQRYLETQLDRFRPDVVFLLQGGAYDCFQEYHLLRWCRANGVPYILNCSLNRRGANFGPQTIDAFVRDFREAGKVLFMSTENLRITEELFREQLGNAVVIQNPLDLEISPDEIGPALPGSRPKLGFVGRIDIHHKGLDLLLEAIARVRPEFDVELHLTGRSEKPEEFTALVERHGLTDRVFVHDHVGREGLIKAYAEAELMVLPSRWEGCASVMLEAMMSGRPQLVTPVGGVSDWLTDGVDAFVAENVSVDA